jgi:MFS family permease
MPASLPRARRGVGGVLVDTGPLRRHPGFRRLWTGQLIASLGSQLTVVAVAYQTYRLTGSTAMVGLVSLSGLVPLLAGSVLGGPAVDAWDRRKVLLVTQVLLAVGAAGLAINATLGHSRLWPLFACTAEAALFQSVDWAARRASLRQLVPAAELPAALSVQSAAFQATLVVGPAAAGLLIAHAGFALVYWLNVICFGAAFLTVARLPALRPEGGGERAGLASLIGGIRYLKSSGPLAGAFLIDLGAMVFGMPRALFPAMAVTVYHGGATTVGYLNAAPGLGALIGSLLTGHVARVRRVGRAVTVCVVGWGLAITGFGLVRWLPAALLLLVLAGAADVVSSVFRMIIVQQSAPDAMQGRVNSLVFAGLQGGPRLGDAEAGVVADLAGPQIAAWSGGLLSVACAIVTCWAIPQFWRYQSTIRPTGAPARGSADGGGSAGEAKLEPGLASGPGQPAGDAGAGGQGPGGPGLTRQS